jgi:Carotenoid biosynthesis protein
MGPRLSVVPIMLGLGYVGMAYLSWSLGYLILGRMHVVMLPLAAALIMTAWDFSQDPVWATILHSWIWPRGGDYFGVPLSNFPGWYLTVYVIYQLFALYPRRRPAGPTPLPSGYWHQALLFYGISAAGNLLLLIPRAGPSVVSDPTGMTWRVSDITGTCALVTIFTMGAFVLLAWVRLTDREAEVDAFVVTK